MAHQLAPLTEKPESLTQIVYQTLRDAIISKRLPPGERVSEASLARQLRVSKTPVREALLRLQAIGLVEADGGRGGRIVRPSADLIRHTYEVRGSLESLAARLAAERATPAQRSELIEFAAASLGAAQGQDTDGFRRHDGAFHDLLAAAAANPYLARLIDNAYTLTGAARQRDVPSAGGLRGLRHRAHADRRGGRPRRRRRRGSRGRRARRDGGPARSANVPRGIGA